MLLFFVDLFVSGVRIDPKDLLSFYTGNARLYSRTSGILV